MPRRRLLAYAAVATLPVAICFAFRNAGRWSDPLTHLILETACASIALTTGMMALFRCHVSGSRRTLFVGAGFLGAAVLHWGHAVLTTVLSNSGAGVAVSELVPTLYLASFLVLAAFAPAAEGKPLPLPVIIVGLLPLTVALMPRMRAELFGHLPHAEQLLPLPLLALALLGFLRSGGWRTDALGHWLIVSLVLALQAPLVAAAAHDTTSTAGHLLESLSYLAVLIGMLTDIYNAGLSQKKLKDLELEMTARNRAQVAQLRERTQQLEVLNQNLRGAVMERDFAQRELDKARLAAEAANRAKTDFLATMSHEIRTPMNGIIGMLELLMSNRLTQRQSEAVQIARSSADALLTLLNDVLDLARIESGLLKLERVAIDLRSVVEQAADIVSYSAATKGLDLVVRHAPDAPRYLMGDPIRLRQVIINLVGNAVKFTEQGTVFINVEAAEPPLDSYGGTAPDVTAPASEGEPVGIRVLVQDTGIGIPQEKLEVIFARYTQVDASTVRRFGGSGLGLAITRQLAELMGGNVTVASEAGQGSTFVVHLPFELDPQPPLTSLPDLSALRDSRVLVVDDNPIVRRVVCEMLGGWGVRHTQCARVEEGWKLLETAVAGRDPYHLALVDATLVKRDGDDLLRRLDSVAKGTRLALVASWKEAQETAVARAGVECFCHPLHSETLLRIVARARNISLPLAPADEPLMRPPEPIFAPQDESDPDATPSGWGIRPLSDQQPLRADPRARVLVVDDNATNQKVMVSLLECIGCQADVAANGVQALDVLDRAPVTYKLILMDLEMPEMDGYMAASEIRRRYEGWQQIPIVAMSANVFEEGRTRAREAGMDHYLCKPIKLEDLESVVRRFIGLSTEPMGALSERIDLPEELGLEPSAAQRLAQLARASTGTWFADLCTNFILDTHQRLRSLDEAAARRDISTVRALLHALIGAGSSMGAQELVAACTQAQGIVRGGGDVEEARRLLAQLGPEIDRVQGALAKLEQLSVP